MGIRNEITVEWRLGLRSCRRLGIRNEAAVEWRMGLLQETGNQE